ncbi:DMT family transporter [Pseudomonas sp. KSR10]|jgi:drug/metabolite transporter (DMT)-like permease|uniref:Multidrug DMT transporter permease n=1 Tax=Stutzerimonas stutzeri TaxID=316 RepID=A0A0D9AL67_STUST|nr:MULTISPECIES: DMT family transporter [Pseudomonadaceae]KJH81482.1 multidrug DMT transporter permease [Stutzerimonas stutzeri]MCG6539018.1 DMT family transporter [Pseudomonas sp. KSR10]
MISFSRNNLVAYATTGLFVLLWSSGAIVSKWGLAYASPFAFLLVRFVIALVALVGVVRLASLSLPDGWKARRYALTTGLVLLGSYQIFYLLALDLQMTPGVMATLLGVQPILTAVLLERKRLRPLRLFGLLLGLSGLVLVVYQSLGVGGLSVAGVACALLALSSITLGSMMQKRAKGDPLRAMPLQYLAGLLLCSLFVPFQPMNITFEPGFWLSVSWMALVISVAATLLLYRLIAKGDLVNVTSLFYLVPAVTAVMDYLVFGNRLAMLSLVGMLLIVLGLVLVFRPAPDRR